MTKLQNPVGFEARGQNISVSCFGLASWLGKRMNFLLEATGESNLGQGCLFLFSCIDLIVSEVYNRAGESLREDVWVERRGRNLTSLYTMPAQCGFKEAIQYF